MPVKLPPPATKTGKGERGTFDAFINAHKALKPYAGDIWTWATNYGGITATQLAAVIWAESRGDPAAKSGVGALGLAQIFDGSANAVNAAGVPFFRPDLAISDKDKLTPAFAIRYMAWRLSGYATTHGGSIDQIWIGGYNPKFTAGVDGPANYISQYLPKGYVGTPGQTAPQAAGRSIDTSTVKGTLTDPWMVVTKDGKLRPIKAATPPVNVLKYGPTPLTQSEFNTLWKQTYRDTFFAYTGRQATGKEVAGILRNAPSIYTLSNSLAGKDSFAKSPVYKAHAPGLIALARQTLGNSWKPSGGIIRKAIAQNWDQATFQAELQKRPEYLTGPTFKDNEAKNLNVLQSIYGDPDPSMQTLVKEVTLQGWGPDQFAAWLRSQDSYTQTPEYQSRAIDLGEALGLITGRRPTMSGAPTATQTNVGPDSSRIAGSGGLTGTGAVVNYA